MSVACASSLATPVGVRWPTLPPLTGPTVFFAFRDSPQRRQALAAPLGSPDRYLLFGLDQLAARGWSTRHNLEGAGKPPGWALAAGNLTKAALERAGGYGGDFGTVYASLRMANRTDVVFSTVDTVGIPLMLSKRAGLVRRPLVYVAIGLPERLQRLGSARVRRAYARALASSSAVIAYSAYEAEELRGWLARHGYDARVEFIPFGVDEHVFQPDATVPAVDVVMVGADPHRDVGLLLAVAAETPGRTFRIVTTADRARTLTSVPPNVEVETDLPFDLMRRRLGEARVVALPVVDNTYSGATTVLLQAMALAKPVVVSRTRAVAEGYGLVDGENCRLVEPGAEGAFRSALDGVLRDDSHARALGVAARRTVEGNLTWERYVERVEAVLDEARRTSDAPA